MAGFEVYGEYSIGNDREAAHELFNSLKGDEMINDHALLHIDLIETASSLPGKVRTKCCLLDELAFNIKLITREVFRQKNLKNYEE